MSVLAIAVEVFNRNLAHVFVGSIGPMSSSMRHIGQLVHPWGLREPHRVSRFPNIGLDARNLLIWSGRSWVLNMRCKIKTLKLLVKVT